jgi:hypothetical protein
MPDPADVVFWRAPDPLEVPDPGSGPPDLAEAARWLAAAPGSSEPDMDPALMAWLGPGPCVELATIVTVPADPEEGTAPQGVSLARALELAPAVAGHADGCPACSDRLRAMVSVGELARREPPGGRASAPPAHGGPADRPAPGSPGDAPVQALRRRRYRVTARAAAGVVLAGAATGAIGYLAWPSSAPSGPTSVRAAVAAISRLPAGGSSLVLDPAATSTAVLQLSDVGARTVSWQAATTAPWLRVAPATGQLGPGQSVTLALDVVGNQASGLRATVTVNGHDGSVAAASYRP